jgi:hypothetical protein
LGILRSIESRLERVVEGSVGRLFRASVAPVELARKLAKELEEGKVVSVTQTYAPNEYTIYLSPRDRTRFADFEASLRNELASYLEEHARRAGYVMPTRPRVRFETESSLHTGIFGISTALVRDDEAPLETMTPPVVPVVSAPPEELEPAPLEPAAPLAEPDDPARSPLDPDPEGMPPAFVVPLAGAGLSGEGVPVPPAEAPPLAPLPVVPFAVPDVLPEHEEPLLPDEPPPSIAEAPPVPIAYEPPLDATMVTRPEPQEELWILHDNQRTPIDVPVVQIGRAPGCEIVLDDRNVSRRHAEIRRRGPVVVLVDLDSTNGTIVNGRRVREHPLADGDRITLGNSRLTFERRTT